MTMTKDEERSAAAPHDLGCFEHLVEEMQEAAAEAGVQLDGQFDDEWRGMTLVSRAHMQLAEGTSPCRCATPPALRAREAAIAELIKRHAAEFAELLDTALDQD